MTSIGTGDDVGNCVAIQGDGKILVGGYSRVGVNNRFALLRYHPSGLLDTSFDGDGMVTTDLGAADDNAYSLALQSDGGRFCSPGTARLVAIRTLPWRATTPTGSLDAQFNGTGKVTTPIGTGNDLGRAVAVQGDGRIVVAGYFSNGSNTDWAVVRYRTDGTLDPSWNGTGKWTGAIGSAADSAWGCVVQADGRIVVAGITFNGTNDDMAVARLNTDEA